ncbi:MAG: hypothetical protein N4A49_09575 [Marinifilaceae bacterium]|jgi:hypothetical protein|nr:hypothetical protein [Marinifilaceae bacterium]
MNYYKRLVLRDRADDRSVKNKIDTCIRVFEITQKYKFKYFENEDKSGLNYTYGWIDEENEFHFTFSQNLSIPAISLLIEANNEERFEYFVKFFEHKLDVYSIDFLMNIDQEFVNNKPYALRISSLATYFIKPYPANIRRLIGENLFSDDLEIAKSAIVAAGISGKEYFKYLIEELVKDDIDEGLKIVAELALKNIEWFEKNKPEFFILE